MKNYIDVQIKATITKTVTVEIPDGLEQNKFDYAGEKANETFDPNSDGFPEKYDQTIEWVGGVYEADEKISV